MTLFLATGAGHPGVDHAHHHRRHRRRGLGAQRRRPCAGALAGNIVWAWIVTIPATAFIAAVFYGLSAWSSAPGASCSARSSSCHSKNFCPRRPPCPSGGRPPAARRSTRQHRPPAGARPGLTRVVAGVPLLVGRQAVDDGVSIAARASAPAGDQQPGPVVVLAQVAQADHTHQAGSSGQPVQPGQRVAHAVQVQPMQAQRAQRQPGRQSWNGRTWILGGQRSGDRPVYNARFSALACGVTQGRIYGAGRG
jgi:hypothetical protein